MKRIILSVTAFEVSYLLLSFALAQYFGQWSIIGELIRTGLRMLSIVFYAYFYFTYFYNQHPTFQTKELLTPPFVAAIVLLLLFATAYTNAENETVLWQIMFVISGLAAGLREELFYRGIVQNTLQKDFSSKTALTLATLLFILSHIQYIYYFQMQGLMLIALAGIIFGSIYLYTGSVAFTAGIHGLYDAILCINISPFRLSNEAVLPLLLSITALFLITTRKNVKQANQRDDFGIGSSC